LRERLTWIEEGRPRSLVVLRIRVSQELTARPREAIEALWGYEAAADIEVARLALASGTLEAPVDPLDVELLRELGDLGPQNETTETTESTEDLTVAALPVQLQASF
jgi:hypothetical protein